MRLRLMVVTASLLAAAALGALVYAQLGGTQTASGSVNVTTTSADLYICEPDATPGPDCGSDDSGADDTVLETLEDITPGETVQWDLRLQNVGTEDWVVTDVTLILVETADPGDDCPDESLRASAPFGVAPGVSTLGKAGDDLNDNAVVSGTAFFLRESEADPIRAVSVIVAAGDYEDVRLRLRLDPSGTENCDGNEWAASWQFTVNVFTP